MLEKNYNIKITDFDEFKKSVEKHSEITSQINFRLNKVKVVGVISESDYTLAVKNGFINSDKCKFPSDEEEVIYEYDNGVFSFRTVKKGTIKVPSTIRTEFKRKSQMIFIIDDKKYYISPMAYNTMLQRLGLSCTYYNSNTSFNRAIAVCNALYLNGSEEVKAIYREADNFRCIYAINSTLYAFDKQNILLDLLHQLSTEVSFIFDYAYISNSKVDIYLTCNDEKLKLDKKYTNSNITPGLHIRNSDVGTSGFLIALTWKVNSVIIEEEEKPVRHIGKMDFDKIIKKAKRKTQKYELCYLSLKNMKKIKLPKKVIKEISKEVAKQISFAKAIGLRRADELINAMLMPIKSKNDITAYDIAIGYIELAQRIISSNSTLQYPLSVSLSRLLGLDWLTIIDEFKYY